MFSKHCIRDPAIFQRTSVDKCLLRYIFVQSPIRDRKRAFLPQIVAKTLP